MFLSEELNSISTIYRKPRVSPFPAKKKSSFFFCGLMLSSNASLIPLVRPIARKVCQSLALTFFLLIFVEGKIYSSCCCLCKKQYFALKYFFEAYKNLIDALQKLK